LTQLAPEQLQQLHHILDDLLGILQAKEAGKHVPLSEM